MRTILGLVKKLLVLILVLVVGALAAALVLPLPGGPGSAAAAFAGPDGRFIDVDGTSTYIITAGPADGPAVVLVHGFGGSTYSWRYTGAVLAAAGYRVVAMDLRGFGLTVKSWDGDYSHAAQARLVLGVMDAVGVESAVLVGHSMGGNVVATVAQIAPDRARALVLVDAAVVGPQASGSPLAGIPGALLGLPPVRRIAQFAVRLGLGGEKSNFYEWTSGL
jgi:pimeloyl-ACP methyl ester carboxylesterase